MTRKSEPTPIGEVGRFPSAGDNAAIALQDLRKGLTIAVGDLVFALQHDVLTGHRFATQAIPSGESITSWEYPFGRASRDIEPGEYLCNQNVLFRLSIQDDPRYTTLDIPQEPNFTDDIPPYRFDANAWQKPAPVECYGTERTFLGFDRNSRGTGTRNHLVILGTSASTSVLVKRLEDRFRDRTEDLANIDAVVGIHHTEGEEDQADERERTLRTLAGLLANPNVGGFLAIDSGSPGELSHTELFNWMRDAGIPEMRSRSLSQTDSFEQDLATGTTLLDGLLEELGLDQRTPQPFANLRIGLQCGASDAFSGISGNVLSGAIAREIIRHGGAANLTETPELSGAEDYTLSSITEPTLATRFLKQLDRFKEQLGWHGGKVDKNPSEGNLLGGLYNITLKSLGAAVKRDPAIPLEHIIEYSERMNAPGFYFMDGMGGDIASYTGQAAAGCNIILFVTGRGTPTSSSIVPTVKIVNTTQRYRLMEGDIDVNAGQYLDGQSMDDLTTECLEQIANIAAGERTKGEKRGQNIDLIWRKRFYNEAPVAAAENRPTRLPGAPLVINPKAGSHGDDFEMPEFSVGYGKVALIIPTVGCSTATARQAADRLNQSEFVTQGRVERVIALPNTEGCGVTTGAEVLNFLLNYATHPRVEACLFLSLGCEMVSPGFIKSAMTGKDIGFPEISAASRALNLDPERFGWITIQDAGGTERAVSAIEDWFHARVVGEAPPEPEDMVRIGLASTGPISEHAQATLVEIASDLVQHGITVVVPTVGALADALCPGSQATLVYAQRPTQPGLHLMECITGNQIEMITGLGAATDGILHLSGGRPVPANMVTPTLNITESNTSPDFDLHLPGTDPHQWRSEILTLIQDVLAGNRTPLQNAAGNVGCQIPRGARAHAI